LLTKLKVEVFFQDVIILDSEVLENFDDRVHEGARSTEEDLSLPNIGDIFLKKGSTNTTDASRPANRGP